ncbi:MAG TPA: DinB family protein [Ignavibacteriaceae bacterium]|mgnify:CR=1 FL=1|nr:DinB family protein [Ignavibacteriaceae bacterium]
MTKKLTKPFEEEYDNYYKTYINYLEDEINITLQLSNQRDILVDYLNSITEGDAEFAYTEGKWTIKEVLGHMIDTERVFSYRAMSIARGELKPLPGFDQDEFVVRGDFNLRSVENLLDEYVGLRNSNIALFNSFNEEQINRVGIASEKRVSVRALIFMLCGHELHHFKILREKYLQKIGG